MMDRVAQLQLQSVFNDLAAAKDRIKLLENEAATLKSEVKEAVRRYDAIERLLESLTPGGSEFAGSPEACARWVRERLSSVGKLAVERNRCQGQAEALAEALQVIYDDITAKNFSQTTFGEYRGGALLGDLAMEHAEAALDAWNEEQPGYAETQYQAHVDL
jgi:chromosome segregation ATPase